MLSSPCSIFSCVFSVLFSIGITSFGEERERERERERAGLCAFSTFFFVCYFCTR